MTDVNPDAIIIQNITQKEMKRMNDVVKEEILNLKKERNAVIMAHYYAPDEAQELADYVGDSFYLAKAAKESCADVIVFCGVSFMGESAKILNPAKTVIMPDLSADCPMAHMVKDGIIEDMRSRYDDLAVVCYINSTAEMKSRSDVCVTSSNAVKIVSELPNKNIFFIPDKNLGRFVAEKVKDKNIILNNGYCHIHDAITKDGVLNQKALHPDALILAHPECGEEVTEISDFVGSTLDIINFVKNSNSNEYIVCTEEGVGYQLRCDNPGKRFYFGQNPHCCSDMKLNNADNILKCLRTLGNKVEVNPQTEKGALVALERMLSLAGK